MQEITNDRDILKGLVQKMKTDYRFMIDDLLNWYDENARTLPWRNQNNAYYTWVSEIMLQQTRVEAVKGYFARFIGELPTVQDLAEADPDKLMKLWEGLGYYNRVRNMQKAAITVVEEYDGKLPNDLESELTLLVPLPLLHTIYLFLRWTETFFVLQRD